MGEHEKRSRRDINIFFLGVLVAVLAFMAFKCSRSENHPPTLAGQKLPAQVYSIDFSKRYTISTGGYSTKSETTYENVKILGFVGNPEAQTSNSGSFLEYDAFGKWLVLELLDGRKVYLPVSAIGVIEEVIEKK